MLGRLVALSSHSDLLFQPFLIGRGGGIMVGKVGSDLRGPGFNSCTLHTFLKTTSCLKLTIVFLGRVVFLHLFICDPIKFSGLQKILHLISAAAAAARLF